MGLGFEALHIKHPRLIVCNISGYGPSGPYSHKKAYDLMIQSEAGFLSVTGDANDIAKAGCPVADISAGMYALSSILAALLERQRTGLGCNIEISMLESLVEWMGFPLYYAFGGSSQPKRAGAEHATIYPYGPFRTGDGRKVILGVQNEREWASLCTHVLFKPDLIKHPLYASGPDRSRNRDTLRGIIESNFAKLNADEIIERLERASIANAMVRDMADVWLHPQLSARGRWAEVDTPAGAVPALCPPFAPINEAPRMDPVPSLGEHNAKILSELGLLPRE